MIEAQRGTDSILLAPQLVTAAATATANLDTIGAEYATIRVRLASELSTLAVGATLSLLQSDDTVVTNFATIAADRTAEDNAAARAVNYYVDLRGKKQYLRLTVTPVGTVATSDNLTLSADATLSRKVEAPSAASEMAEVGVIVG